ncbi:MAG: hypothetical protein ACFCVH_14630 [Alphaproteobacteria bacterium]
MKIRTLRDASTGVLLLAVAGFAAGCQSTPPAAESMADESMESMETMAAMSMVSASDQAATDSIVVASVTMESAGFVTIHASNPDGSMIAPDSIGHVAVPAGTSENVVVPLDTPVAAGDVVHVMLHEDTGEIGVYEFRAGATEFDLPVMMDGQMVMTPITIQ